MFVRLTLLVAVLIPVLSWAAPEPFIQNWDEAIGLDPKVLLEVIEAKTADEYFYGDDGIDCSAYGEIRNPHLVQVEYADTHSNKPLVTQFTVAYEAEMDFDAPLCVQGVLLCESTIQRNAQTLKWMPVTVKCHFDWED